MVDGKPMIASYEGSCFSEDEWAQVKAQTGGYLMPFVPGQEGNFGNWPSWDSWLAYVTFRCVDDSSGLTTDLPSDGEPRGPRMRVPRRYVPPLSLVGFSVRTIVSRPPMTNIVPLTLISTIPLDV